MRRPVESRTSHTIVRSLSNELEMPRRGALTTAHMLLLSVIAEISQATEKTYATRFIRSSGVTMNFAPAGRGGLQLQLRFQVSFQHSVTKFHYTPYRSYNIV